MTTSLFEQTRIYAEKAMLDVNGDDDFYPMLGVLDHKGDVILGCLNMPETSEGKDVVAFTMSAICAVNRASAAAFTSVAWIVERMADSPDGKPPPMPDLPPSQCADRQEIAMISMLNADGTGELHVAPVIRENNLVGVGLWEEKVAPGDKPVVHTGRFFDALRYGLNMVRRMPPDLAEYVDGQVAAGQSERLIQMMVKEFQSNTGGVQK